MKTRTIYICDFCNKEHYTTRNAIECEATHLGLTVDQYKEYMGLLKEERDAFGQASCASNDQIRKRCDDAVKAVLDFQKKYGFTDNR